jgi:hypothetical protein
MRGSGCQSSIVIGVDDRIRSHGRRSGLAPAPSDWESPVVSAIEGSAESAAPPAVRRAPEGGADQATGSPQAAAVRRNWSQVRATTGTPTT